MHGRSITNWGKYIFILQIQIGLNQLDQINAAFDIYLQVFLQENQNIEGMNLLKTALKRPDLIQPISDLFVPSITTPDVFLQLYKFIIDSHMKNCDPKILFVLLSKVWNFMNDFQD